MKWVKSKVRVNGKVYSGEYPSPKKKKMQFSQKITLFSAIFSMAIVVAVLFADFLLLWFDKQAMPQETITTISIYGGITSTLTFGGYCALSCLRDCSKNKHSIKDE